MNAKEIIKILKENGFIKKSQKGSHEKYIKDNKTVIVPIHGKKRCTDRHYKVDRNTKRFKVKMRKDIEYAVYSIYL